MRKFKVVTPVTLEEVERYLPAGYHAWEQTTIFGAPEIVVTGDEYAGWTWDGYVIPRLASGRIFLQEFQS